MSPEAGPLDFAGFLRRVLPPLGLAPRPHHRRGVRRKLARRLEALGLPDYAAYAALIEREPAERRELAELLTVTISRFFRNRTLWEHLVAHVLPGLCAAPAPRAWSAGCASGEEPYSLAMLWRRVCPLRPLLLLATDLDPAVLARAEAGLYPPGSLREVPGEFRELFGAERAGLRLAAEVRGMVTFRRHDLRADPPPEAPFDLILCRNLAFTYFGPEAQAGAARGLAEALAPGGWLAVGRKERLPEGVTDLAPADYPGLYRKGR